MAIHDEFVLAITNQTKKEESIENENIIHFTGFVYFIAKGEDRFLPPYLPAFDFHLDRQTYFSIRSDSIENEQSTIVGLYSDKNRMRMLFDQIRGIGTRIYSNAADNIQTLVDYILSPDMAIVENKSLVIFTNDPTIPWHWMFHPKKKEFLIDNIPIGTIFLDETRSSLEKYLKRKKRIDNFQEEKYTSKVEALKDKKVLFIEGEVFHAGKMDIPDIIQILQNFFNNDQKENEDEKSYISPKTIGSKTYKSIIETITANEETRENLKIIHYSGHIKRDEEENKTYMNPIKDEKIFSSAFQGNSEEDLYLSEPLVFLNGCGSGNVDIIDKSASFATSILNKGASACIITLSDVHSKKAFELSREFYNILFCIDEYEDINYGRALMMARNKLDKEDPHRFLFHLYGDPEAKLCYVKAASDPYIEIANDFVSDVSKWRGLDDNY